MLPIPKSVEIGGKEYPIFFGMSMMLTLMENHKIKTLEELFDSTILQDLKGQISVCRHAINAGVKKNKTDYVPLDIEQTADLLDENPEVLPVILTAFMDSVFNKKAQMVGEDPKKYKEAVLKLGAEILQKEPSPPTASKK